MVTIVALGAPLLVYPAGSAVAADTVGTLVSATVVLVGLAVVLIGGYALHKFRLKQALTERDWADGPYRQTHAVLSAAVDMCDAAVIVFDGDGKVRLVNGDQGERFGFSAQPTPLRVWHDRHVMSVRRNAGSVAYHDNPLFQAMNGEMVSDVRLAVTLDGGEERVLAVLAKGDQGAAGAALPRLAMVRDVSEQEREAATEFWNRDLLALVTKAQSLYIQDSIHPDLFDTLLSGALRLTGCATGFIAEAAGNTGENEGMTALAVAGDTGDAAPFSFLAGGGRESAALAGVLTEVVTSGDPCIINGFVDDRDASSAPPLRRPDGVENVMVLPVCSGSSVVAVVGLANCPGGFEPSLTTRLTPLLAAIRRMVAGHRAELQRLKVIHDLAESERRFETVLHTVVDGIITIDSKGLIETFNAAAEHIFGYAASEVKGQNISMLMPEPDRSRHDHYLSNVQAGGGEAILGSRRAVQGLRKNGEAFPMELAVSSMEGRGERKYTGIVRDITELEHVEEERHRLETQLRHVQKLETIGQLAGGIAHDFNNMLTPILGYVDLSLSDVPEGSRLHERLQKIDGAARRAKELVEQILIFSKRREKPFVNVDLGGVISDALHLVRAMVPSSIDIQASLQENAAPVFGDATQLHQMIVNLVTNASLAVAKMNGLIEVELSPYNQGRRGMGAKGPDVPQGKYLRLTVRDNGCGMSAETRDHMFDPFFTTRDIGEGTGLGLAVVHGVVVNHSGAIQVESEVGQGTQIDVYLPMSERQNEESEGRDMQAVGGTERILFVDDEAEIVEVGAEMLDNLGYQVTGVTSSSSALNTFEEAPDSFDLIITDHTMPGMTGDELTRRIHAIRPDVPVILVTGFSASVTPENYREFGIKEFVMKPVTEAVIDEAIRRALSD